MRALPGGQEGVQKKENVREEEWKKLVGDYVLP